MLSPTNLNRPMISPTHPTSSPTFNQSNNQSINQSNPSNTVNNQSINQSKNQSMGQTINQLNSTRPISRSPSQPAKSINQSAGSFLSPANQSTNHPMDQSGHSLNQSINQRLKKLPKCNLRLVFVVCTILNVAIASLVLWGIGYQSQLSIVDSLSGSLRRQTLSHAIDSINQLLSYPLMALNELDTNSELRESYTSLAKRDNTRLIDSFDYSNDPSFFAVTANTISHFPGVTGALTMAASGTFIAAVLNTTNDPPPLVFFQQDRSTDWKLIHFQIPNYTQSISYKQLFSGVSSASSSAKLFTSISQSQLDEGRRLVNLTNLSYYSPGLTPWYNVCAASARRQINQSPNKTITNLNASWVISQNLSRTAFAQSTSLQICKPHMNWNPNSTKLREAAERALAVNSPQATDLMNRAREQEVLESINQSMPILDFVTVVTWNPAAMKEFLVSRLNNYVTESGAAFLVTSDFYMIASTLRSNELALLVDLKTTFRQPISQSTLRLIDRYPVQIQYLEALNDDLKRVNQSVDINELAGEVAEEGSIAVASSFEWVKSINGKSHYVQVSILPTPGSPSSRGSFSPDKPLGESLSPGTFSWILVMYSPVSEYEGPLQENLVLSGVVSAVVLVCSILVTIVLTRLIHQPVMTLVSAMQHVVDTHKHSASKLVQSIYQSKLQALVQTNSQPTKPTAPVNQSWWRSALIGIGFAKATNQPTNQSFNQSVNQTEMVAQPANKPIIQPTKSNTQSPQFNSLKVDPNLQSSPHYQSIGQPINQPFSPPENAHSIPTSPFFNENALKPRAVSGYVFNTGEPVNQSTNSDDQSLNQSVTQLMKPSTATILNEYDLKRTDTVSALDNPSRSPFDRLITASMVSTNHSVNQSMNQPFSSPTIDTPASLNRRIQSDPPVRQPFNQSKQVTISEGPSVAVHAPTINQPINQSINRLPASNQLTNRHQSIPHSHAIHIDQSPNQANQSNQSPSQTLKPTTVGTVRHEPSINHSVNGSRENSQSDDHDLSSYELDRLLRKWQRTMASQGVRPPDEWEADAEMRAQWEAERAKKERRRKQIREQERQKAILLAGLNNQVNQSPETNQSINQSIKRNAEIELIARAMAADDHSIFVADEQSSICCWPCDKVNAALAKRSITQSINESQSSRSHSSDSSSHTGSSLSNQPSSFCLPPCLTRSNKQWFAWMGSLSEIVQLEMTFGWLLFKLRNSQVKLEKANEAKQLFLRFVFHEVRIPLNALSLGVHQLEDLIEKEQQANQSVNQPNLITDQSVNQSIDQSKNDDDISSLQLISIIKDQVATVARILNDVLSFSRLEDNELHLEFNEFSVPTMLSNLLHSFHSEFKAKSLTVNVEFLEPSPEIQQTNIFNQSNAPASPQSNAESTSQSNDPSINQSDDPSASATTVEWKVIADQYRLRQVLSNFISNACKFSDAGSAIRILTRLTPLPGHPDAPVGGEISDTDSEAEDSDADEDDPDGDPSVTAFSCYGWLEFSVHDYGIGIPPDSLKTLFQAYRQIRPGALQEGKGSGLGLSISKKLVELHGGSIQATSEAGRGSVFSFSVPVRITQMCNQVQSTEQNEDQNDQSINQPHTDKDQSIDQSIDQSVNHSPDLPHRSTTTTLIPLTTNTTPSLNQSTLSSYKGVEASPSMPFPRSIHQSINDLDQSGPMPSRRLSVPSNNQSISEADEQVNQLTTQPKTQPIKQSINQSIVPTETPLRVIVIEDSAVNRKLLCMMLRTMKLNVDSAEDGRDGWEKVVNQLGAVEQSINQLPFEPYDCMFVDDHMPHMTGVELTGKLREMGIQCPIFGVTGNALLSDQARFRAAGVTKVLTKPVSKAAIAQAVQQAKEWKRTRENEQERLNQAMD